ncbi:MAG: hypothetical protein GVY30_05085 [Chloroflexi bacterium]|nr:hypothetical protein [Chloroflexota bacterium]
MSKANILSQMDQQRPQRSKIDTIADKIASQWQENGETLDSMLEALQEEREKRMQSKEAK